MYYLQRICNVHFTNLSIFINPRYGHMNLLVSASVVLDTSDTIARRLEYDLSLCLPIAKKEFAYVEVRTFEVPPHY